MFHHLAQLPRRFCHIPISPSRIGQTVEHSKSKSTKPSLSSLETPCTHVLYLYFGAQETDRWEFEILVLVQCVQFVCSSFKTHCPPSRSTCTAAARVTRSSTSARTSRTSPPSSGSGTAPRPARGSAACPPPSRRPPPLSRPSRRSFRFSIYAFILLFMHGLKHRH